MAVYEVVVKSGTAVSNGVNKGQKLGRGYGVETPSALDACDLTLQVSYDGLVWLDVGQVNNSDEYELMRIKGPPTAKATPINFPAGAWIVLNYPFVRIRCVNTASEASVNQSADRVFKLMFHE